ncbi:uncharacterized protein LOC129768027 [Toxorhynchites rutilus septentrionalis]|uniref:uncharacterized protein LOC129768027 n=1 Tax=Toxorhynchites rutilus septentrionalis TaxID=329112 RepID=UPI0024789172|nr:uncharacterized protein LOC129768027 [Toxorhynchites rutilus septentrionalis]
MTISRSARKNFYVVWHRGRLDQKILFFLHPFLQDLLFVWVDIWSNDWSTSLPAIVKVLSSVIITGVMLLPVFFGIVASLAFLGFWSYQIESLYPGIVPVQLLIHRCLGVLFQSQIYSDAFIERWNLLVYRSLLVTIGTIDYLRMLMELV